MCADPKAVKATQPRSVNRTPVPRSLEGQPAGDPTEYGDGEQSRNNQEERHLATFTRVQLGRRLAAVPMTRFIRPI